tara:strand:- start:732 stop:1025 length:294 start_codon:yes stop_codon:yes gene_type:complete
MPVDKTFENEVTISNEDRGNLDLTKRLEDKDLLLKGLVTELNNLKKEFALKVEESQALYLEIENIRVLEEKHKKLNGELRKEIDDLKKDAKEMLQYP